MPIPDDITNESITEPKKLLLLLLLLFKGAEADIGGFVYGGRPGDDVG
jgi:hypothetical protein